MAHGPEHLFRRAVAKLHVAASSSLVVKRGLHRAAEDAAPTAELRELGFPHSSDLRYDTRRTVRAGEPPPGALPVVLANRRAADDAGAPAEAPAVVPFTVPRAVRRFRGEHKIRACSPIAVRLVSDASQPNRARRTVEKRRAPSVDLSGTLGSPGASACNRLGPYRAKGSDPRARTLAAAQARQKAPWRSQTCPALGAPGGR